jgi:peptidoglycan/LPS O-acetylase OafA/YrhL
VTRLAGLEVSHFFSSRENCPSSETVEKYSGSFLSKLRCEQRVFERISQNLESAPTQNVANLPALTGVRAPAAFWVVALHFTRFDDRFYDVGLANALLRAGGSKSHVIFVLSGSVMTHVYWFKFRSNLSLLSWGKFLQNRLVRLYPVHVVSALTMLAFALVA